MKEKSKLSLKRMLQCLQRTEEMIKKRKMSQLKVRMKSGIRIKNVRGRGGWNGKQIDKGVILDVKEEDGKKLCRHPKKLEVVEAVADGASPIQKTAEDTELKGTKK